MTELTFPPLFQGYEIDGAADPVERAVALAVTGTDSGTIVYNLTGPTLKAALVFAPEVSLEDAVAILPVCGLGFQAALGALAPPEVAVHLSWDGKIRVNGAACGRFRLKSAPAKPTETPDWLVLGLELDIESSGEDPGQAPDKTYLIEEGCAEVSPSRLLESWIRHSLYWINRWQDEGARPIHEDWRALVPDIGETVEIDAQSGTFVGVDEQFGMLLRVENETRIVPLSTRLEG